MATPMKNPKFAYFVVSNIPAEYHSKDLRNYFSQFLEAGGFDCFHFRHRPEQKPTENGQSEVPSASVGGVAPVADPSTRGTVESPDKHEKSMDLNILSDEVDDGEAFPRHEESRNFLLNDQHGQSQSSKKGMTCMKGMHGSVGAGQSTTSTTCCVIRLVKSKMKKLTKMYMNKHWVDSEGYTMPQLCQISRLTVTDSDTGKEVKAPSGSKYMRGKHLEAVTIGRSISKSKLLELPELNPPDIMPNGNVGTPTPVFSQLIKDCKLPPKVINQLGIVFPRSRTNKRYGNVPFDYGREVLAVGKKKDKSVRTQSGHKIFQTGERGQRQVPSKVQSETEKNFMKQKARSEGVHNQSISPPESEEDEDSGEEWERHEALHNDVTNQERTTERLFESEMEVTWDKGSSGLVFYTDAAYWDKQEGDFDEKTADDWDVDMSAYYDPNGGDKDARDFLEMRRQQRRLQGIEITSVFTPAKVTNQKKKERRRAKKRKQEEAEERITRDLERGIGSFEEHTKGIGRKLMEAQGWVDGEGLGKEGNKGMNEALFNEGQSNYDKRGFGYYGEKLKRNRSFKKHPKIEPTGRRKVVISTVYDDPEVNDPIECLLRSQGPYNLKYMDNVTFTKATDRSLNNLKCLRRVPSD